MADTKPSPLRLAARNLFLYAVDMGCALAGFIFGFGLTVHSWWAVIGFMVLSRWVFSVVRNLFDARKPQGGKEAAQRERFAARFANRATTQATADFDLPAQSDVVQPQGGSNG